ncbi:hypothetical protein PN497_15320 [Sphaerospermopsis kisseleviana CS-549]|uniref:Uncharacterized protein n=1 Tax=Sphaerospermopsis kisseleviana CS-549 TaxID=3021783 RepID=A0ABT4ZUB4_9CYAN|nr:hypothetical protein [Sphaerospermopsis kisseleviana]MDB9442721.1 hypothetical protein [Sphaerospermopsis kisseleviana CS-549]
MAIKFSKLLGIYYQVIGHWVINLPQSPVPSPLHLPLWEILV